jgi:3,4-dihydroxyphenylacetate 2,3-dioxygenase
VDVGEHLPDRRVRRLRDLRSGARRGHPPFRPPSGARGQWSPSHKFWPLRELRHHEGADPSNLFSPAHRSADHRVISLLEQGDHATVLAEYPEFRQFSPEGRFAHYVVMACAQGGAAWKSHGVALSDYENAAGTGNIQMWFPATA